MSKNGFLYVYISKNPGSREIAAKRPETLLLSEYSVSKIVAFQSGFFVKINPPQVIYRLSKKPAFANRQRKSRFFETNQPP